MNLRYLAVILPLSIVAPSQRGEEHAKPEDLVKPLIVMITAQWDNESPKITKDGAGIVIGQRADKLFVLTANHVVTEGTKRPTSVNVRTKWLVGQLKQATPAEDSDPKLDLAVLILTLTDAEVRSVPQLPYARLGDSTQLVRDVSRVRAMGYPQRKIWYSPPSPSAFSRNTDDHLILFDGASIVLGFSGGGLFNDNWELVGMVRSDGGLEAEALTIERAIAWLRDHDYPVVLTRAAQPAAAAAGPAVGHMRVNPKDGLPYVWAPSGEFLMGCGSCEPDESPLHKVNISRGFWMGKTEVTQQAWERVMGTDPSQFKGVDRPVENVSWYEAYVYCDQVGMRLPTEAEWEYASRPGAIDQAPRPIDRHAWSSMNSQGFTQAVGQKQPNAFGLLDMLGNVWEWVADWHQPRYYFRSPAVDPRGPEPTEPALAFRGVKGGGWRNHPEGLRASIRGRVSPESKKDDIGFRCVAGQVPAQ